MVVEVSKVYKDALIPRKQTQGSAGFDLRFHGVSNVLIEPHDTALLETGLRIAIPEGHVGLIFARSGLAVKKGLAPANKVGVIDSDYRGEIMVALHNDSNYAEVVEPNDRIAQIVFVKLPDVEFTEVSELSETDRGYGGFGSTGER